MGGKKQTVDLVKNDPFVDSFIAKYRDELAKSSGTEDLRFSLNTDSEGNKLSSEQIEFFKDSKVRDENGNLLVVLSRNKKRRLYRSLAKEKIRSRVLLCMQIAGDRLTFLPPENKATADKYGENNSFIFCLLEF